MLRIKSQEEKDKRITVSVHLTGWKVGLVLSYNPSFIQIYPLWRAGKSNNPDEETTGLHLMWKCVKWMLEKASRLITGCEGRKEERAGQKKVKKEKTSPSKSDLIIHLHSVQMNEGHFKFLRDDVTRV